MLLFMDGFDYYSSFPQRGYVTSFGANGPVSGGRFGTKAFKSGGGSERYIYHSLPGNYAELIAGYALQVGRLSVPFFTFYDDTNPQITFWTTSGGAIEVRRGFNSTVIGTTASGLYVLGTYNYWEFRVLFSQTVGQVEIRLNGNVVLNLTGQDTCATANEYANRFLMGPADASDNHDHFFDDLYILDTTDSGVSGAPNDDFLGDVKIETQFPSGNGNSSQFTGSDGNSTDNYLLVDETSPDDDTTYVESSTVGQKDTYATSDLATGAGTIYGIQLCPRAKKTDAGTRSIKTITRLSGTEDDGPETFLGTSYLYYCDIREADPAGSQWTISNVNAAEAGHKVFA